MPEIRCEYTELRSIKDLKPHPKNPNKHSPEQIERLAKLIDYQGIRHPIVVSKLSGNIVAGHGRWAALKKLKAKEVPIDFQDFQDEIQEYAFLTSDNAISEWAELDLASIQAEAEGLVGKLDLELLGLKDPLAEVQTLEPQCDEDEVPETAPAVTVLGDIYELGNHRLLCGDSTDILQVEKLMKGEKADMVFTDPPYGMKLNTEYKREDWGDRPNNHSGGNKGNNWARVAGDHDDFSPELINAVFAGFPDCAEVFLWGADYYAEHIPCRNDGSWIVWDKVTNRYGEESGCSAFHGSNFELCWSKGKHKRDLARVMHKGLASVDKSKRVHPTQKPIQLAEWFFERWGEAQDRVVDLFGGSGSTLIACEKTNRKCFMMELDPHYVDVIVTRWCKYTGQTKIKRNGEEIEWKANG